MSSWVRSALYMSRWSFFFSAIWTPCYRPFRFMWWKPTSACQSVPFVCHSYSPCWPHRRAVKQIRHMCAPFLNNSLFIQCSGNSFVVLANTVCGVGSMCHWHIYTHTALALLTNNDQKIYTHIQCVGFSWRRAATTVIGYHTLAKQTIYTLTRAQFKH